MTGTGTETFVAMCSCWRSLVDSALADMEPGILLGILRLIASNKETTQKQIVGTLKIKQSCSSKLVKKLINHRMIRVCGKAPDGRCC